MLKRLKVFLQGFMLPVTLLTQMIFFVCRFVRTIPLPPIFHEENEIGRFLSPYINILALILGLFTSQLAVW